MFTAEAGESDSQSLRHTHRPRAPHLPTPSAGQGASLGLSRVLPKPCRGYHHGHPPPPLAALDTELSKLLLLRLSRHDTTAGRDAAASATVLCGQAPNHRMTRPDVVLSPPKPSRLRRGDTDGSDEASFVREQPGGAVVAGVCAPDDTVDNARHAGGGGRARTPVCTSALVWRGYRHRQPGHEERWRKGSNENISRLVPEARGSRAGLVDFGRILAREFRILRGG